MGTGSGFRGGAQELGAGQSEGRPLGPTEPHPSPQEPPPSWMLGIDCPKPCKGRWPTPPFDPRFPKQNQTRNCYQNFLGKTSRAKLGGAGERRWEAGRGAPHLRTRRGSRTRRGGGDLWGGRWSGPRSEGAGPTWEGRGLV